MEALGPKRGHIWMSLCRPALIIFSILTLGDDSFSKYTDSQQDICLTPCIPFSHSLYFPSAQVRVTQDTSKPSVFEYDPVIPQALQRHRCPAALFKFFLWRWRTWKCTETLWHMLANLSNATRPRVVFQLVRSSIAIEVTPVSKAVWWPEPKLP